MNQTLVNNSPKPQFIMGQQKAVILAPTEKITINTFIPQNNIDGPPIPPHIGNVFEGDDRLVNGQTVWNKDGSYRTQQKFNALPFQNLDDNGLQNEAFANEEDGVKNDEWFYGVGTTREYDKESSLGNDGKLTAQAKADMVLNDDYLKVGEATADKSGISTKAEWINDKKVEVECIVSVSNPLVAGAPAIDYIIYLTIDYTKAGDPRYSLTGKHDGFPAYEVYIGKKRIYEHDPIATGEGIGSLGPPLEHNVNENSSHINLPIPK